MTNVRKKCHVCWKLNYFKRVCCSVRPRITSQRKNTKQSPSNPKVELTKLQLITPLTKRVEEPEEKSSKEEIYCTILMHCHEAELKIVTGARCNVEKLNVLKRVRCEQKIDKPKSVKLTAFGVNTMFTLGTVKLNFQINSTQYQLEFHIIDKPVISLLGRNDSREMKLIKLNKESTKCRPAVSSKTNF